MRFGSLPSHSILGYKASRFDVLFRADETARSSDECPPSIAARWGVTDPLGYQGGKDYSQWEECCLGRGEPGIVRFGTICSAAACWTSGNFRFFLNSRRLRLESVSLGCSSGSSISIGNCHRRSWITSLRTPPGSCKLLAHQ